uniref:Uncharacterized protein n=1 Tax=Triticum urartu TaxID=4572 RepID=A0A8R7VLX7_TRIUA
MGSRIKNIGRHKENITGHTSTMATLLMMVQEKISVILSLVMRTSRQRY